MMNVEWNERLLIPLIDAWLEEDIGIEGVARCGLRVVVERDRAQFYYSVDLAEWRPVGDALDITHLSDDFGDYVRFTGTFVGLCAQDLSGTGKHADFDYFVYRELE